MLSSREASSRGEAHMTRLATIGELTASILHQVNGALTYTLLNLEFLERTAAPESLPALLAVREGLETIRESVAGRDDAGAW